MAKKVKGPKGLPQHEVFETPDQRYMRHHANDGIGSSRFKKILRKILIDEKNLNDVNKLEAEVQKKRFEISLQKKKKSLNEELDSYQKERKRLTKIVNDFRFGGAKSSNDWKQAMQALKDAKGFGDIVQRKPAKAGADSAAKQEAPEPTEVVIIEADGTKTETNEDKPKEQESIW